MAAKHELVYLALFAIFTCTLGQDGSTTDEGAEQQHLLYEFTDQGGEGGYGDYERNIHASAPQVHKNLNFQLPFFGFKYNYIKVSVNGFIGFSDPQDYHVYPLVFPNENWPKKNDPGFIGIFFTKARVGNVEHDDIDQRRSGVYYRVVTDLRTADAALRDRLMRDFRAGVAGSGSFIPGHVVIVTWKNVTFAGGVDKSKSVTNTFQLVLATNEVQTYAMFNYADIQWTTHTEAGGDSLTGQGGVPAFVGFNAGNGTRSFEYHPYSQSSVIRHLIDHGCVKGLPGRHMFRVDTDIIVGACNNSTTVFLSSLLLSLCLFVIKSVSH